MNSEALFNETIGVMAVVTMIPVFFVWLERKTHWRIFDFLPAIIWIFLTPIFLSNLDVLPFLPFDRSVIPRSTPIYTHYKSWAVPMFIVLMLLDINIKESLKKLIVGRISYPIRYPLSKIHPIRKMFLAFATSLSKRDISTSFLT